MKTKRLIKSLSALSLVATFALPLAAHARPIVEYVAAPASNHTSSPSREVYYATKDQQYERLDNAGRRGSSAMRRSSRTAPKSYAEMKAQQLEGRLE